MMDGMGNQILSSSNF